MDIQNVCGNEYLKQTEDNSIDLILTDPPYIISRDSGMDKHYEQTKPKESKTEKEWEDYLVDNQNLNVDKIKEFKKNYMDCGNIYGDCSKTQEEWDNYFKKDKKKLEKKKKFIEATAKENYMKYGTIYGKKYAVKTNYGSWDDEFTLEQLEEFIELYYKKLKKGGTMIMFFDLWKIETLKDILEKYNFKQIRMIEWIKTNPQPLNSSINYLTNCREIALVGVKGSKPTFNSKYDKGIYEYPFPGGKTRFHPTQKSLNLFEDLIKKHSNENDVVLDTFLGSGTTYYACKNTNRIFKGCELNKEYFDKIIIE
tara:strand:+ start:613 stop:1542 length:930 start_codon:yes stop_codon:yes gene_type:complete